MVGVQRIFGLKDLNCNLCFVAALIIKAAVKISFCGLKQNKTLHSLALALKFSLLKLASAGSVWYQIFI